MFIIEDFVTIEQDWYLKFYFKILDKDFTGLDSVFIVNKFKKNVSLLSTLTKQLIIYPAKCTCNNTCTMMTIF